MSNNTNRLREVRENEGLAITELSRLSGVSEKTIRYVENGERSGTRVTKNKIINGLNRNPQSNNNWRYKDIFNT